MIEKQTLESLDRFRGLLATSSFQIGKIADERVHRFAEKDISDLPFAVISHYKAKKRFEENMVNTRHLAEDTEDNSYALRYAVLFSLGSKARSAVVEKLLEGFIDTLQTMELEIYEDPKLPELMRELRLLAKDYADSKDEIEKKRLMSQMEEVVQAIKERNKAKGYNYEDAVEKVKAIIDEFAKVEEEITKGFGRLSQEFASEIFSGIDKDVERLVEGTTPEVQSLIQQAISDAGNSYVEFIEMTLGSWDKPETAGYYELLQKAKTGQLDREMILFLFNKYGGTDFELLDELTEQLNKMKNEESEDHRRLRSKVNEISERKNLFKKILRRMGYLSEEEEIRVEVAGEPPQVKIAVEKDGKKVELPEDRLGIKKAVESFQTFYDLTEKNVFDQSLKDKVTFRFLQIGLGSMFLREELYKRDMNLYWAQQKWANEMFQISERIEEIIKDSEKAIDKGILEFVKPIAENGYKNLQLQDKDKKDRITEKFEETSKDLIGKYNKLLKDQNFRLFRKSIKDQSDLSRLIEEINDNPEIPEGDLKDALISNLKLIYRKISG